jgi:GTP-binding protein Era
MQERMNAFVSSAFEDADVLLFVVVPQEEYEEDHHLITRLKNLDSKVCVGVNKTDTVTQEEADEVAASYKERIDAAHAVTISALNQSGTAELLDWILTGLPKGPAYYPKDQMTDRPERFFSAVIYVERDSQKNILIGKGGQDIKAVGSKARQRLESFFGKKVFLETRVKVRANWRNDEKQLKRFGYE